MTYQEYLSKIDIEHAQRITAKIISEAVTPPPEGAEQIILKMCLDFIRVARYANLELVEKDDFR